MPIIFRAVEQFFIRMDELRPEALHAIDEVKWIPPWGRNRIYGTVESRPDWCISRQRTWGVPIPVFYDTSGQPILRADWIEQVAQLVAEHGTNIWFDPDDTLIARSLGLPWGVTRRNDTLDVWIDSGVSHEAVVKKMMGIDGPADMYLEATDQHRGWFQSSLITSIAMNGRSPYKECLTHGFVVDVDTRKKISKSQQGQYSKPTEAEHFVNKHGADVVRLWVASVNFTDEVPFGEEMFARLAETYRRLRNTLRILLGNLSDFDLARDGVSEEQFTLVDRWIAGRLQEVVATCREAYAAFEFHRVYHTLNQFCAVDLSSLYVDITKDRMYCDRPDSTRRRATQTVMHRVFDALCRLLAPLCPFTAEEAWNHGGHETSVHLALFPDADARPAEPGVGGQIEGLLALRAVISQSIEAARQEKLVGNALEAEVTLHVADPALRESAGTARCGIGRVLHPQRSQDHRGRGGRREPHDGHAATDTIRALRALLAASLDGRRGHEPSRPVRPLRGRRFRALSFDASGHSARGGRGMVRLRHGAGVRRCSRRRDGHGYTSDPAAHGALRRPRHGGGHHAQRTDPRFQLRRGFPDDREAGHGRRAFRDWLGQQDVHRRRLLPTRK